MCRGNRTPSLNSSTTGEHKCVTGTCNERQTSEAGVRHLLEAAGKHLDEVGRLLPGVDHVEDHHCAGGSTIM